MTLVTYEPKLTSGFWYDDFDFLHMAGRLSWSEFLNDIFDPRVPRSWYRPIQQLQWRIEYMLFGADAFWYHTVHFGVHLINCLLLFALIGRLTRNWRAGFIGALIYSVLPAFSISVFQLATADALATLFYLATIWLWVNYLEHGSAWRLGLTFAAFVFGLLSKEIVLTLPFTLLLVDRWLVAKPAQWKEWVARNAPFFLFLPFWVLLEWNVIAGKLAGESARADWGAALSNLAYYISALTFPWGIDSAAKYITLLVFFGFFIYALITRKFRILFLGVVGVLSVVPMASSLGTSSRYLYLPLMVSAAGIGIIVEGVRKMVQARVSSRVFLAHGALALVIACVAISESIVTAQAAEGFSGLARQTRLQFRPIYQQHPTFAPNTLLYFIEPPFSSYNISGLMFLRYGANVVVEGNDYEGLAGLRQHGDAYVFFPDEQGVLSEQRVDPVAAANVSPSLPAQFGTTFSLDGFEVVNTTAKPGESLILMLYWRARGKIDRDYTVFAHLLDEQGTIVAGYDGQPHRGSYPTTVWNPGDLVEDAIILPITPDVPAGRGYRIEVGLYYLPTSERLPVADPGSEGKDAVIFSSFSVEP